MVHGVTSQRLGYDNINRQLDALEAFSEKSSHHYFGRVVVNENEYLSRMQNLENALRAEFGNCYETPSKGGGASPSAKKSPFSEL